MTEPDCIERVTPRYGCGRSRLPVTRRRGPPFRPFSLRLLATPLYSGRNPEGFARRSLFATDERRKHEMGGGASIFRGTKRSDGGGGTTEGIRRRGDARASVGAPFALIVGNPSRDAIGRGRRRKTASVRSFDLYFVALRCMR